MGSVTEPAPGEYGPPEPRGTGEGDSSRDTRGDHGFFGQPAVVPQAETAIEAAAGVLLTAFGPRS